MRDRDVKAVLTNKNQQGVFRGAGSEVHNWVLERLVDARGRRSSASTASSCAARNLIQPDQFPYKIPTGNVYDSGDYPAVLDKALAHADLDFWRAEQARARERGALHRHRASPRRSSARPTRRPSSGSTTRARTSACPTTPESVRIGIGPTGGVSVTLFSPFWGNSPETVAAQLIAEELGVDAGGRRDRLRLDRARPARAPAPAARA